MLPVQKWIRANLRRFVSIAMVLGLVIGGVVATQVAMSAPALAMTVGTNDYPYANYDGPGSDPATYDWYDPSGTTDFSPLRFVFRNCTDYAAYEVNEQLGGSISNIKFSWSSIEVGSDGNARAWKQGAINMRKTVDTTPAVGSVAWWGTEEGGGYGHVAIVSAVSTDSNTITISDYNSGKGGWGNYASYPLTKGSTSNYLPWPDNFLHLADVSGGGGGSATSTDARNSDADGNGASDLVLTTSQPNGGSAAEVLLSTWQGFLNPQQWWADSTVGWSGITPLVGDINGDGKADYLFMANSGSGTNIYVALSNGSGFGVPQLWWQGTGWGYTGIKPVIGDVTGDGKADVLLVTNQPSGGSAAYILQTNSTGTGFLGIQQWWQDPGVGWYGITPLLGDMTGSHVNGYKRDDFVFLANAGNGTNAYVAASNGSTFGVPQLWWQGTGWGYTGIKPVMGDVDGNGADDLVLVTNQPNGGSAAEVLLSTYQGFLAPQQWWADSTVGWSGITPLLGDMTGSVVNGFRRDDFVFLANGGTGTNAYVAASTGSSFGVPQLWWQGTGWGYSGINASLG